jgi:hypothetical protein
LLNDAEDKIQDYNDLDSSNLVLGQGLTQETPSPSLHFPVVSKSGNLAGQTSRTCGTKLRLRCIESFFQNFSSSHPFLPPRNEMLRLLKTYPMHHLESAICFVGSRYLPGAPSALFAEELDSLLLVSSFPRDGSTVQALLLFALGLDSDNDQKKASEVLLKAETLALELGMNYQEYAVINSLGSSIYEESLRRTWWELYIVRIMMAGFHQRGTFCPKNIMSTVPLPCEEREFAAGVSLIQILWITNVESNDHSVSCHCIPSRNSRMYLLAVVISTGRHTRTEYLLFGTLNECSNRTSLCSQMIPE